MDRIQGFVESLRGLDRRALAELRRSLAFDPGSYPAAYPSVERYVVHEYERRWFYLHAGLFALCAQSSGTASSEGQGTNQRVPSLGGAVAQLYAKRGQSPSIEQRFIALLDADEEQMPYRLRQMVALIKSEEIPMHWEQLLKDLLAWSHERRYVQQRWARQFYRSAVEAEEPNTATAKE